MYGGENGQIEKRCYLNLTQNTACKDIWEKRISRIAKTIAIKQARLVSDGRCKRQKGE